MARLPPYSIKWQPDPDDAVHLRSAAALARFALTSPDLTEKHRTRLLNGAIWYRTEAAGKIQLRYRSGGVLAMADNHPRSWRSLLRHDHVQTRASLVARMKERPEDVEQVLTGALACLVTSAEHNALGAYDGIVVGWDRYCKAGVDVYDFSTDPPTPLIINGHWIRS